MEEQAKLTLERVIRMLDEKISPAYQQGSFKAQAERLKPDDEQELRRAFLALKIVSAGTDAIERAVARILIGENVLTPSLATKGWMFWKQAVLTENEKKAIESAVVRCAEAQAMQAMFMKNTLDKLPVGDPRSSVIVEASLLDVTFGCLQKLSSDLKRILLGAEIQ